MKRKSILLLTAVFLLAAAALFAAPRMVIEYFENNSGGLYVRGADGAEKEASAITFGDELPVGSTLITLQGDFAELRLDPNGTIVRVSENTNFTVKSVQGRDGASKNAFGLAVGKVKTVASKTKGAVYSFEGNTAVCGVRGTKFIFSVLPGQRELAYVLEGLVDFTNQAGQVLALQAGMAADALASSFASFTPPAELQQDLEGGTQFQQLNEDDVAKGEPATIGTPGEDKTAEETGRGQGQDPQVGPAPDGLPGHGNRHRHPGRGDLGQGRDPAAVQDRQAQGRAVPAHHLPQRPVRLRRLVPAGRQRRVELRHRPVRLGRGGRRPGQRPLSENPLHRVGRAARSVLLQVRELGRPDHGSRLHHAPLRQRPGLPVGAQAGPEPRPGRQEGRVGGHDQRRGRAAALRPPPLLEAGRRQVRHGLHGLDGPESRAGALRGCGHLWPAACSSTAAWTWSSRSWRARD